MVMGSVHVDMMDAKNRLPRFILAIRILALMPISMKDVLTDIIKPKHLTFLIPNALNIWMANLMGIEGSDFDNNLRDRKDRLDLIY